MRTVSLSNSHAAGGDGAEGGVHPKSFDTDLSALQQQVRLRVRLRVRVRVRHRPLRPAAAG